MGCVLDKASAGVVDFRETVVGVCRPGHSQAHVDLALSSSKAAVHNHRRCSCREGIALRTRSLPHFLQRRHTSELLLCVCVCACVCVCVCACLCVECEVWPCVWSVRVCMPLLM